MTLFSSWRKEINMKKGIHPKYQTITVTWIVNRRTREGVGMGITAFRDQLFLSFPYSDESGKKIASSEIFEFVKEAFTCNELMGDINFLYKKQGVKDFARQCGKIYAGELDALERLSSFYWAVNEKEQNQTYKIQKDDYYSKDYLLDDVKFILEESNKKQKIKLEKNKEIIVKDLASPTTIENYFTCPYKAFLSNGLKVRERDKGEIDAPKIGTLIHEIFASYAKEILSVYDKQSSDQLFEKIKTEVLKNEQFSRFLLEKETQYSIENALSACKKLCYNLYHSLCRIPLEMSDSLNGDDGQDFARGIERITVYDKHSFTH